MLRLRINPRLQQQTARAARGLSASTKQMRFATAVAMTRVARKLADYEGARLVTELDRPTPFTVNAFRSTRATRDRLSASVLAKPIQAAYLKYAVFGGVRNEGIVVPVATPLNQYGNIPNLRGGRAIDQYLAGGRSFAGQPKWGTRLGPPGVWMRMGSYPHRWLKLIMAFEERAAYQKRFPFFQIARDAWDRQYRDEFHNELRRSIAEAFATAR